MLAIADAEKPLFTAKFGTSFAVFERDLKPVSF
jgi:hypothetical protein